MQYYNSLIFCIWLTISWFVWNNKLKQLQTSRSIYRTRIQIMLCKRVKTETDVDISSSNTKDCFCMFLLIYSSHVQWRICVHFRKHVIADKNGLSWFNIGWNFSFIVFQKYIKLFWAICQVPWSQHTIIIYSCYLSLRITHVDYMH